MIRTLRNAIAAGALLVMIGGPARPGDAPEPGTYPPAPTADVVDDYHGTKVADPYRPLEELDAEATREWVEAENAMTGAYLGRIAARDAIRSRLTELWDYEKFGIPREEGRRYFFSRNSGLQNQSVLYVTPSLDAEPRVLLDPNKLSEDGTVALSGTSIRDDGAMIAYGLAAAGSDWQEWKVRDVATGDDTGDVLKWIKFSTASWAHDGKGFYYGRFPEPEPGADLKQPNYHQKLYFHTLGTPQADDRLVYERPDQKEWQFSGEVTDAGDYLVITVSKGTDDKFRILYQDLTRPDAEIVELIDNFEHEYTFVDNDGPVFYFKTNRDAPRGRLIAIDVREPDPGRWEELIPQAEETLEGVDLVGGKFLAVYLKDAHSQVKVFGKDGTPQGEVALPGLGSVGGFAGEEDDEETFYAFTSFNRPTTIYRYDLKTGESTIVRRPEVAFDPDDYATEQVFYRSEDGTKIPMFLSYKKGSLRRDGSTPTLLYGYGGFNIAITPSFSPSNLVWMEMGGLLAVANLRGGGEYGEEWHQAGTKLSKQNVFDDFIAAAEYLIAEKYTSTPKLAIEGRSNGGLLVGACLAQRPDLFGAALPGVGVLDMLRFHKFTIGWAWIDDYGSADDPEQFEVLYRYSPLHNLKAGTCYPPTLITTADHDDRVFPAHSFKFAAALQAAQGCDNPILIRIETRAGHGAGKPTSKLIEEAADKWAFLVETLGVEVAE